jgi:epoxyqueuosine reductase
MDYLARPDAVAQRADPRCLLPEARTVLVVAATYGRLLPPESLPLHGRVARYAWDEVDYHRWLLVRLRTLLWQLASECGPFPWRAYVDTGPILERAWAQAAGLGWVGKNTNLIHPHLGSYIFLGVALLGLDLSPTAPPTLPTCGDCHRCMDACPTQAIVAPGVVAARRCLAYLTIEYRGAIPEALRPALGAHVFGCDVCQEVCPWNHHALRAITKPAPPERASLHLPDLLLFSEETFRARFRYSALWRATVTGLARNAAVVLGNCGDPAARPCLARAAREHPSALVREHAAWGLAQLE